MAKYQIKGTYKGGKHNGKWFVLQKGGRVANHNVYQFPCFCYQRKADAQRIATMYNKRYGTEDDSKVIYEVIEVK